MPGVEVMSSSADSFCAVVQIDQQAHRHLGARSPGRPARSRPWRCRRRSPGSGRRRFPRDSLGVVGRDRVGVEQDRRRLGSAVRRVRAGRGSVAWFSSASSLSAWSSWCVVVGVVAVDFGVGAVSGILGGLTVVVRGGAGLRGAWRWPAGAWACVARRHAWWACRRGGGRHLGDDHVAGWPCVLVSAAYAAAAAPTARIAVAREDDRARAPARCVPAEAARAPAAALQAPFLGGLHRGAALLALARVRPRARIGVGRARRGLGRGGCSEVGAAGGSASSVGTGARF